MSKSADVNALPSIAYDDKYDAQETSGEMSKTASTSSDASQGLKKYSYSFWAPEIRFQRNLYLKVMGITVVIVSCVIWIWLSVFWGSFAYTPHRTNKLEAWLIDMDGSTLGSTVRNVTEANINLTIPYKLGWEIIDPSRFPSSSAVGDAILDEQAWVAIVVESGATAAFASARENGDSTYDGSKAITIYYNEARNEVATDNFVMPYTNAIIAQGLAKFAIEEAGQYLAAQSGNTTAMSGLINAPQFIAAPVSYTVANLRPYNVPVAGALVLTGNVWVIIMCFFVTVAGASIRPVVEPYLKDSHLFAFRVLCPMVMYIPLSLFYSMISLSFKVPFDAHYSSYGRGFFTFWSIEYLNWCALGLAEEAMATFLGADYIGYFLPGWIIINASVGGVPIKIQAWFYKYGFGFPVYNMSQATRTIIFNTKSRLGLNVGVLIAWVALSWCTIPIFSMIMRKRQQATERRSSVV